jgi:protease II
VDTIRSCSGDAEWGADDSAVFYTKMDSEHRPFEVWLHVLGMLCYVSGIFGINIHCMSLFLGV